MAKKTFIDNDNPVLQFISASPKQEIEKPSCKPNPIYLETKSRRLQLVLQPSLFEKVKAQAKENGLSVNEFVHQILNDATEKK